MTHILLDVGNLLSGRVRISDPRRQFLSRWRMVQIVLVFGILYGAVMGSFGGVVGERFLQVFYSAIKVPLLLFATFAFALPSFFVLNTLAGLRDDFRNVVRGLVASQAGLTIILAALAPYTAFWYASTSNYQQAILFNAAMFGIASVTSQFILASCYRPLVARNPRHRLLMRVWIILYAFVGIQMAWVLRPFIGSPDRDVQFFRDGAWGNAYVVVSRMIWNLVFD